MTRLVFRLTLALAVASCSLSAASAVTIDFDDGADDSAVGAFYAGLGVTFLNTQWTDNFSLAGTSGPLGISAISAPEGEFKPEASSALVAQFSSGVSKVSIVAIDVGERGARIDAYDSLVGGSLVDFDEAFGPDIGVGYFFTLNAASALIRRIELYQPNPISSSDGMLWEDLTFEVVPEPSSLLLAATGIALLGLVRYRRRTSTRL